jgi:tetratricopeptide (TPR) repeat protein
MHLGYFKEAISSLTQYLKLEPDNVHALCAIAECYENINYIPQALNCYSKAIKIDAKCATAHYGKGILLMETRDYNQALNHLQQALYIDPNNTEYYYSLGVLLLRANVNDMAMQVFHKITILDPYDIESWLILSELVSNNNIIQGLAVLQQACRHNPANATIHFRIAAFYFILKNRAGCVASLKQALSIGGTLKDDFLTICPTAMKYKYIQQIYSRYKK